MAAPIHAPVVDLTRKATVPWRGWCASIESRIDVAGAQAAGAAMGLVDQGGSDGSELEAYADALPGFAPAPAAPVFTSRSVPYSGNSAVYPDAAPLAHDPNKLAFRSDTLRFGVNAPNGNTQYPLEVYGSPVDIGYMARLLPSGAGSAYTQMVAIGVNEQAGFSFYQNTNQVEWRMAVIGNDGNAMRWTSISSGGAVTTIVLYAVPVSGNLILDTARNDVTTGTKCFVFGNGTAPTAVAANTSALFAGDDAASSELFVINEAGEITQLSGNMTLPAARLLRFGGSAATFPALKRASAVLEVKLADDSAYADLRAFALRITDGAFALRSGVAMTDGAGAGAGTLTNAPSAGDPTKWIPFDDNGTTRYFPVW